MSDVIRDAETIARFLNDDVIQTALEVMAKRYYDEFKQAKDEQERLTAQSKAHVLDDFQAALRGVVAAGEHETILAERQKRRENA